MTFVFTNGNYFAARILKPLLKKYKHEIKVVLVSGDYYGNTKKEALFTALKSVPISFIAYKIFVFSGISFFKFFKKGAYSVSDLCNEYGIETFSCQKVNSGQVKSILDKSEPKYLVSVSCPQIIKSDILSRFKGCINIHSSLLPKYGGLAPYFWVLKNSEKITGTTVHYMSRKLDQGNILMQEKLEINSSWSMFTLFLKLCELGADALLLGYEKMKTGDEGIKQNLVEKTYFSNPCKKDLNSFTRKGNSLIKLKDILTLKSI